MQVSKIHLSEAEIGLVTNTDVILTKNIVLKKMHGLLKHVEEMQLQFVHAMGLTTQPAFLKSPKISKGENYLGLPYIVLDYPRLSGPEDFLFIRSMFWWGNFFSSTLQAGGNSKETVLNAIKNNQFTLTDYYIGINPDPWHHHFLENNFAPISSFHQSTAGSNLLEIVKFDYIKLAAKWPLSDWASVDEHLFRSWKVLLGVAGLVS